MADKITFNHDRLKGLMRERKVTQAILAENINISTTSLSNKLNGYTKFSPDEMIKIQNFLGIDDESFKPYFFTLEVRKTENIK